MDPKKWIVVCSLVTTVCCVLYVPSGTNRKSLSKISGIELGSTSREEVLRVFGPPNVFTGETTLVYEWKDKKGTVGVIAPGPASGSAGVDVGTHLFRAMAKFDGQSRLISFDLETYPYEVRQETVFGSRRVIPRPPLVREFNLAGLSSPLRMQMSMRISPDRDLVAGGNGGTIRLWRIDTGEETLRIPKAGVPTGGGRIAFSPDGRWLAFTGVGRTGLKAQLVVWDLRQPAEVLRLKAESETGKHLDVVSVAFFPDNDRVAIGSRNGEIHLLRLPSGEELLRLPSMTGPVGEIDISPDRSLLAAAGPQDTTRLVDLRAGRVVQTLAGAAEGWHARAVRFSPDGRFLAVSSRVHLEIWDVSALPNNEAHLQQVALLPILSYQIRFVNPFLVPRLAFSADGTVLAAISDYDVSLWEVPSGRLLGATVGTLPGSPDVGTPIYDAIITEEGRRLLTAEADRMEEWDLASLREVGASR